MRRHVAASLGARAAERLTGTDDRDGRREPVTRALDRPGGRRLLGLLLLHSALTQVVTFVLRPTSSYRAIELDVPAAWLGALTASFAIVPLLLAVPSGQATDRFGERRVMLVGSVLDALSGAVFLTERGGAAGLVLGSVVLGTGHLFSVVGQQAAVANTAGPGRFDTAFGYYTFAASLGQAIGPGADHRARRLRRPARHPADLPRRHRPRRPAHRLHRRAAHPRQQRTPGRRPRAVACGPCSGYPDCSAPS